MADPHPDAYYAEIALLIGQMRRDGRSDDAIAARLGVGKPRMRRLAQRARERGHPVPYARDLRNPKWRRAAEMAQQGKTTKEIGAALGIPSRAASKYISFARHEQGWDIPFSRRDRSALGTVLSLYNKGAAPKRGYIGAPLRDEDADFARWLLDKHRPGEDSLAHTLVRLVKENLYEPR